MILNIVIAMMTLKIVKSMADYTLGKRQIMFAQRAGIYQLKKNLKL